MWFENREGGGGVLPFGEASSSSREECEIIINYLCTG